MEEIKCQSLLMQLLRKIFNLLYLSYMSTNSMTKNLWQGYKEKNKCKVNFNIRFNIKLMRIFPMIPRAENYLKTFMEILKKLQLLLKEKRILVNF